MKKIAIITARSGSKGLPNKNVLFANGKPLMAYSIEAALESREFEKIIVSTDSQEYIDLLSHYPIEFIKRSVELSSDKASSFVVIEDVLNRYSHVEYDYFVLLQPTSPLRTAQHIQEANKKFEAYFDKFDFLVSVSDAHKPTTLTRPIDEDESLKNFKLDYSNYARQQYHPEYSPNGAIFSAKPQAYLEQKHFYGEKCIAYFMAKEVSVDIDDRLDFEYFYFILQQRNKDKILLETIKKTISAKKDNFNQTKEISLIGHSILDYWNIEEVNNQAVNNLAIAGITTKQYIDLILGQGLIQSLGDKAILMFGTNDIVYADWTKEQILSDIQQVIEKLKAINNNIQLYFLEITPVALRIDRNNAVIRELNVFLKENLKSARWIALDSIFSDHYGKLNLDYTNDGLHLNEQGYQLLEEIIKSEL
ncbi:cytidylyltransferase domain-containing protein [Haemophilus parainfluenzae]|jgi:nnac (acylneuraminate cytidylyltransferase (Ec 2.7.7.43))|uniref:cytidylyltransferase domain-containing protein n=1 Tax=Haemophilus parainfluenzae TaxID=729 RepID=UPI000802C63F|nr:GDSL-type esterase/lipase family protein [Haemophilus parainfluenzae]OBX71155.1 acylneuraminate cytidylyltransferase [Haemophilus parainfluenzae]